MPTPERYVFYRNPHSFVNDTIDAWLSKMKCESKAPKVNAYRRYLRSLGINEHVLGKALERVKATNSTLQVLQS